MNFDFLVYLLVLLIVATRYLSSSDDHRKK